MLYVSKKTRRERVYLIMGIAIMSFLGAFIFTALSVSAESIQQGEAEIPEAEYLLSPYDEIEINVAGEDDLTGIYKISGEDYITFPVLGKVKIDELTIGQAEEKIANLLEKDYFKTKVTVFIQVKKFHKRRVIISGEVRNPGPYELGEDKSLSLVDLIALAGGSTEKACLNAATVIRPEGKGRTITFRVRAGDILAGKEADIALKPGDRITIPRASVIVMGEVTKAGKYDFGDVSKMTLLGAISIAGGFTRIAAINDVRIIRVDELGNKKSILVRVNNIYKGKEKDVALEPDDIIVVPESWF